MDKICMQFFKTPFGEIMLGDFRSQLCLADWRYRKMRKSIDARIMKGLNAEYVEEDTPLIKLARIQLREYFKGERKEFSIPLLLAGSKFQKEVWKHLLQIPFGVTDTYLGLSKKMNNSGAIRAIAAANGANAISIIVPCHRVIGSDNKLVGYAGGLEIKKKLLLLENIDLSAGQLKIF